MPDRSVFRMIYRSSDGELVVKQHIDTDELFVSAGGNTARFAVKGRKVTFLSAAEEDAS